MIFVTTTYGRTEAIDARPAARCAGATRPAVYRSFAGSAQITTMTPIADPDRTAIYAGAPGRRDPQARNRDRQGALVDDDHARPDAREADLVAQLLARARDRDDGRLHRRRTALPGARRHAELEERAHRDVWNSLCADRHAIIQPSRCGSSDSAIWARSGAVVDPATGNLLVATGNAPFDGKTNWGDSVLVLSPDASRIIGHWTPDNQAELNSSDLDLGSTAPCAARRRLLRAGRQGRQAAADLDALAEGRADGVDAGLDRPLLGARGVEGAWVFVADSAGTDAWRLEGGSLEQAWSNGTGGNSPVIAGGLLYVQGSGGIHVYNPASGHEITVLPCGDAHWQSPIVVDGRVIAVEGDANQHSTSGALDIYSR